MEQQTYQLEVNINKKLKEFSLDADFTAQQGCLGILGASGCGKSMTLKSIAGIVKPDGGSIVMTDERGNATVFYDAKGRINVKPQKRRVGYLFQNYALFPNMTVEQNIVVGLKGGGFTGDRKRRVQELLELFHIRELGARYPAQLSGGQQQRVALARIFAYEPEILLLDEPFSAMDTFLREGLRLELMHALEQFHGITVLVTHDRDEAYQMCGQLLLMDKGRVIGKGSTQEIFDDPRTVDAARLTGCKNISRITRLDAHRVRAIDWGNLVLCVDKEVEGTHTHIGIRAHDFHPTDEKTKNAAVQQENFIQVTRPRVSELPFEWYILLENGIWWKQEKSIHNNTMQLPEYLYIDPKAILVL